MVVSVHPELVCTVTVEDAPRSQMRLLLPHSLPIPAPIAERCSVHDTVYTPTSALIINNVSTGVEGEVVTVEGATHPRMRLLLPHSLPTPALTAERYLVHDAVLTPTFALIINIVLTGVEGEAVDFLPAKYKGDTDRWTSSKSMVDHIYT